MISEFRNRVEKSTFNTQEISQILNALHIAEESHKNINRIDGLPYIEHAVAVADILLNWNSPAYLVSAGLLHDVMNPIYSVPPSRGLLIELCGENTEYLVNASAEFSTFSSGFPREGSYSRFDSVEKISDAFPEIMNSFSQNPLMFVLRIANHLHNSRSIRLLSQDDQQIFARIALNILAPISFRLGIDFAKRQLEDIGFQLLEPEVYEQFNKKYPTDSISDSAQSIIGTMNDSLINNGIDGIVRLAPRSTYSIYRGWLEKGGTDRSFASPETVHPYLVIVESTPDCYLALGITHSLFTPTLGGFKDFIAIPKVNDYQGLHTKLRIQPGKEIEVIVRDRQMDRIAENGLIAKWTEIASNENLFDKKFPSTNKDEVLIFTPNGELRPVPIGSTPVDFAYLLHKAVGNQCVGAIVSGESYELNLPLQPLSTVKIQTSQNAIGPETKWLDSVKTNTARAEIRKFYGIDKPSELIDSGRSILLHALDSSRVRYVYSELMDRLNIVCSHYNESLAEILTQIAQGRLEVDEVVQLLTHEDIAQIASDQLRQTHTIITIVAIDRIGLLADIADTVARIRIGLETVSAYRNQDQTSTMKLSLGDVPKTLIDQLIQRLGDVNGVENIYVSERQPIPVVEAVQFTVNPATGPLFKGREAELSDLATNLEIPGNAILLWGPRRIGKTSVLSSLPYRLDPDKCLPLLVDLQNTKLKSTLDVIHNLMESINSVAPSGVNIPKWSTVKKNPFYSLDNVFRVILEKRAHVVLIIDEFQNFKSLEEQRESAHLSKREFTSYLRAQFQKTKRFSMLLSGGGILNELAQSEYISDLLELTRIIELGFLKRPDARKIITESRYEFDHEAVERILDITSNNSKTANHPVYVQILCRELAFNHRGFISLQFFTEWLDRQLPNMPEFFFNNLWGFSLGFNTSQQRECQAVLVAMASILEVNDWVTEDELLKCDLTHMMSHDRIISSVNRLLAIRTILRKSENINSYQIKVPLAVSWLRKSCTLQKLSLDYPKIFGVNYNDDEIS